MTWLGIIALLFWTIFCIAIGVLLSKRAITTMTSFYAERWDAEQRLKGENAQLRYRVQELEEAKPKKSKLIL